MKRFSVKQVVSAALLFVPVLAAAQVVSSQAKGRKAIIVREVKHDTSPPLRDIPNKPDRPGDRIRFHLPVPPNVNGIRTTNTSKSDPAAQRSIIEMALPAPVTTFEAIGETRGDTVNSVPPDTVGDVGPNHYVQWVNTRFAVFSRAGVIAAGFPKNGNTLWTVFGGMF